MKATESRRYADIVGPDIGDIVSPGSTIILPVGAVEQHGPHLPMSVDDVIATETTNEVVRRFGSDLDLWQLPSLSISKSNEHAWSPGTLWYSAQTMMAVLNDIGRSISTTKAERLVLLNGHGGNTTLLVTALRELRLAYGLKTFLVHPSLPPAYGGSSTEDELGMGIHGGLNETSVFMHLRPDLVDLSRAERKVPEVNHHVLCMTYLHSNNICNKVIWSGARIPFQIYLHQKFFERLFYEVNIISL